MAITHSKVSGVADGADTTLVRPSDWNANHAGQPTSISDFLDNTAGGTDAELTKAPTSNVMYDHAAAATGIHGAGTATIATTANITTHGNLTTGVHGVGTGTVAKTADITATKLDDLTAPDDNTDLNSTTSAHGLLLKLDNVSTNFLNGQGAWAAPAGGGGNTITWRPASSNVLADVNRTTTLNWTDLDLTAATSASTLFAIVHLRVHTDSYSSGNVQLLTRKNGDTPVVQPGLTLANPANTAIFPDETTILACDTGQVIEYYLTVSGTAQADFYIDILGYIE